MTSKINLIPENDYVFIKHEKVRKKTMASGIIIAEVDKHKDVLSGEVIAINPNCDRTLEVKVGDIAYFIESDVKSRTTLDNQEYVIISESNILAVNEQ